MKELKIVATLVVKPEFQSELVKVFCTLVDETRKEAGNISYELHQDIQNPLKYIIWEVWSSQEAIDSHNESPHFKAFVEAIDGRVDNLAIDVIRKVY